MEFPKKPVTFNISEVQELNKHLSEFRHNVNNCLALVIAAAELVRRRPDTVEAMAGTMLEQPQQILEEIREFSEAFEKAFGIVREPNERLSQLSSQM